jgi:hypothetical protein
MIRVRLQEKIEDKVCNTQFGFRPKKSTSHALYVIRRIQDYSESTGNNLSLALLDWEKAFDKIEHDKLFIALKRLGVNEKYIKVLQNCYSNPQFLVKDKYGESEVKKQSAGIRQGCPLSPYLFILLMTCVHHDIQHKITNHVKHNRIPGINYDMIYYADDTILFSTSTRAINELLKHTEEISRQYGLKLNKEKCVAINMNTDGNVKFGDGTSLTQSFEAMYLGCELNKEVNIKLEISNKMNEVRKTWFKLAPYWKSHTASTKWQLIIYDAIIRSKLLYGLETVHLTPAMERQIDAFQMRGLRQIMKYKHTYYDRTKTNAKIIEDASREAYPKEPNRKIQRFSVFHKKRKVALLGHLIRTSNEDPLRQITFKENTATRADWGKRRPYGPRQNWVKETKKTIWVDVLKKFEEYKETEEQDQVIFVNAHNRLF